MQGIVVVFVNVGSSGVKHCPSRRDWGKSPFLSPSFTKRGEAHLLSSPLIGGLCYETGSLELRHVAKRRSVHIERSAFIGICFISSTVFLN